MIRHLAGLAPNMRGALFMVIAMAGFSCNDAMIKLLALDLDLYQAIFLRGMVVTTAFAALAAATGGLRRRIGVRDRRALTGRTIGEILGAFCFLTALTQLPMANATAILQSMPLAITLAAAWMLNEPVGWRRYAAIAVGFFGVLVIVRPGSEGFNAYALLALIAVGLFSLRDLSTRLISPDVPTFLAAGITSAFTTLAAGIVSIFTGWHAVAPEHLLILVIGSACLMIGYSFSIIAMRTGDVAVISPFRYTLLIWAMLLGWAVYGDIPDVWMVIGALIVVASGIYTFNRERRAARNLTARTAQTR